MEHERILHLLRNPWGHRSDDLDKARHAAADALEKWHRCVTHPASAVEWIAVMQAELSALRAHRDELTEELGSLEDRMQELRARVADLSMLVRRLSRYAPPGLAGDALDYLKRHGLEGSPMRDAGNKTEVPK